jgi:hypothetical protein
MAGIGLGFSQEKAIEAILFVANRIPHPTFHSISKVFYFADKLSLERYGRFISGDSYFAMEHGPVPSETYGIMQVAPANGFFGFRVEGYNVFPLRDADMDCLSESDIECLDHSVREHGPKPFRVLKKESHDQAYKRAWASRGSKKSAPMSVERIAEQLSDAASLIDYLKTRHAE